MAWLVAPFAYRYLHSGLPMKEAAPDIRLFFYSGMEACKIRKSLYSIVQEMNTGAHEKNLPTEADACYINSRSASFHANEVNTCSELCWAPLEVIEAVHSAWLSENKIDFAGRDPQGRQRTHEVYAVRAKALELCKNVLDAFNV